jgi:threonine aldolase
VYVSFYKDLRGIAGAVLAGPEDVIAEARVWHHRHGGKLYQQYPFVLAAKRGLDAHLPHIGVYHTKTVAIAAALRDVPDIEVTPDPPQVNMLHIFVRGDRTALWEALLDIAEEHSVCLTGWIAPSQIPAYQMFELTVGNAADDFTADDIRTLFAEWIDRARAHAAQ